MEGFCVFSVCFNLVYFEFLLHASVLPICTYMYHVHACGGQKRVLDPLVLELLQIVVSYHAVLGIEPGPFGLAVSALNCWATSQDSICIFYFFELSLKIFIKLEPR